MVSRFVMTLLLAFVVMVPKPSLAVPFIESGAAAALSLGWALGADGNKKYWALLDPSVTILSFSVVITYDPTIETFLPAESGWLCSFSDNPGNCPSENIIETVVPSGPRPGTTLTITQIAPNEIQLSGDLSGNPVSGTTGDIENIAAIAFEVNPVLFPHGITSISTSPSYGSGASCILYGSEITSPSVAEPGPVGKCIQISEPRSLLLMIFGIALVFVIRSEAAAERV